MASKEIEMQSQPPDKELDKPPIPPKRDYNAKEEHSVTVSDLDVQKKNKRFSSFQHPEFILRPKKDSSYMTCLKNLLILFNLLIWLFGAILLGLGIWVKVDKEFWEIQTGLDIKQFTSAGYILIAAGLLIMMVGFLGCYGAMALKLYMLVLYAVIIVIIIFLELAVMGIVWTATKNKDTQEEMKRRAKKALQEMTGNDEQRYLIDLLQTKLECCGIDGPDDYKTSKSETGTIQDETIPRSCTDPTTGFPRQQGCLEKAISYFQSKASVLGGIAVAVFVLQLLVLAVTLIVACGLKHANSVI